MRGKVVKGSQRRERVFKPLHFPNVKLEGGKVASPDCFASYSRAVSAMPNMRYLEVEAGTYSNRPSTIG